MAAIRRILGDQSSTIRMRHATIASIFAAASVAAGVILMIMGAQIYARTSERVLWALLPGGGVTG